jgi:hypothetical protein
LLTCSGQAARFKRLNSRGHLPSSAVQSVGSGWGMGKRNTVLYIHSGISSKHNMQISYDCYRPMLKSHTWRPRGPGVEDSPVHAAGKAGLAKRMTGWPQATFCREGSSTWETLEAPISAPPQRVLTVLLRSLSQSIFRMENGK